MSFKETPVVKCNICNSPQCEADHAKEFKKMLEMSRKTLTGPCIDCDYWVQAPTPHLVDACLMGVSVGKLGGFYEDPNKFGCRSGKWDDKLLPKNDYK